MEDIQNSMDELGMRLSEATEQIQEMNSLFSKATEDLGKGIDSAIIERLDNIISQNEKIAQAILALAEMIREDSANGRREEPVLPSQKQFLPEQPLDQDFGYSEFDDSQTLEPKAMPQRQQYSQGSMMPPPLPPQMPPMPQMPPVPQPSLQMPPVPQAQQRPAPQGWQPYPADDLKPLPLHPPKRGGKEELRQFSENLPPPPRNPMPRTGMY